MPISKAIVYLFFAVLAASCVPISTVILLLNYLYISFLPRDPIHKRLRKIAGFKSRTILITGVNTTHGLRLARAFHYTGHKVVGLAYESEGSLTHVRFSKALSRLHRLPCGAEERREIEYIATLVHIIEQERADLWINCSSTANLHIEAQARDVIERNTKCQSFALRVNDVPYFASREAFLKYLTSQGLPVPETYQVTSRAEIHNVLNKSRGSRKYLLEQNGIRANPARTMLPSRTISQTYNAVSRITITNTMPWRLEQDINDLERYSTFAIIVRGSVKAFVANRTIHPGCYRTLEPRSALNHSMLRFIHTFARKQGQDFTTHLGIDFCVEEQATESGVIQVILPVQVFVHPQNAMQLFHGMAGSILLTRAYLACFATDQINAGKQPKRPTTAVIQQQTFPDDVAMPDSRIPGTYCFGRDLLHLCFEPLRHFITFRSSLIECLRQTSQFLSHLIFWEDDTYNFQDPLPFWFLYQIYIPLQLIKTALFADKKGPRESTTAW